MGKRMAAIDVGSNTVRAMAAELLTDGRLVKFADDFLMTALGRGLADTGEMPADAIATTAEFVSAFLAECGTLDEVYCVGTGRYRRDARRCHRDDGRIRECFSGGVRDAGRSLLRGYGCSP